MYYAEVSGRLNFLSVDTFNVIDNYLQPARAHKLGDRGFINDALPAYPAHDLKVWVVLEEGKHDEAEALFDSFIKPLREYDTRISKRSCGEARSLKEVMGHPAGPSRPPALPSSREELDDLREIVWGFGWLR